MTPALLLGCRAEAPQEPVAPAPCEVGAPGTTRSVAFADPPENVLMISIDTLRRDRIGRYGSTGLTPFLDGLLAESVVLDQHQSCSNWTFPSSLCALLGQSALDLGAFPLGSQVPDAPSLATHLDAAGFATALVSGNSYIGPAWPTGDDYAEASLSSFVERGNDSLDQALGWLAEHPEGPWFLHVHLVDPHAPYDPPAAVPTPTLDRFGLDARSWDGINQLERDLPGLTVGERAAVEVELRALYDAEIRALDSFLADFWADANSAGRLDDTLVVLWSDHGEQFWEHGAFRHGNQLYGEENAAVGAFWAKGLEPAAVTTRTTHLDLLPTVLSALELPIPEEAAGEVVGLAAADRVVFAHTSSRERPILTITRVDDRLHLHWSALKAEWYDLFVDPTEEDVRDVWGSPVVECLEDLGAVEIGRVNEAMGREVHLDR